MKPITYWIQNEAIDKMVERYGTHFEKLSPNRRREMICSLCVDRSVYLWEWLLLTESLTRHEKDLLIEAIAATLTAHGNPWVENARANVAIAQKEGISSP